FSDAEDAVNRDRGHATVIDGAMPQFARATERLTCNDLDARTEWPRLLLVGRSKDRQGGNAERRGDVHRSSIVSQEQLADWDEMNKFSERGLSRERYCRYSGQGHHFGCQRLLRRRSEKHGNRAAFLVQPAGRLRESRRRPALCGSKACSRTDSDDRRI